MFKLQKTNKYKGPNETFYTCFHCNKDKHILTLRNKSEKQLKVNKKYPSPVLTGHEKDQSRYYYNNMYKYNQ